MKLNMKCWTTPIDFVNEFKELTIAYGWTHWPSRCEWIVPGTIKD